MADNATTPPRPAALPVLPDNIPAELRERPQWVCWHNEPDDDKWRKVPYDPIGGRPAKSNTPQTWSDYESALRRYRAQPDRFDGIGYEFSKADPTSPSFPDDPYTGVDLDKCRDQATGAITPWALDLLELLGRSYTEVSPSATGVKIWVKGRLPAGCRHKVAYAGGAVEAYERGRYFTVTGHRLPSAPPTVEDCQAGLEALVRRVGLLQAGGPRASTAGSGRVAGAAGSADPGSDDDLIGRILRSRSGDAFRRLWAGDVSGHDDDDSRADLALANILAWWTRHDTAQMDRLFRQSGLMRDKWDAQRGAETYGERTIRVAIEDTPKTYRSPGRRRRPQHQAAAGGHTEPPGNGQQPGEDEELLPAAVIIRQYWQCSYNPTFRRGAAVYSATLGRELKVSELMGAPTSALIDLLEDAADRQRNPDTGETSRSQLPSLFKKWGPVAWGDLLAELQEEGAGGEVCDLAEEEFRGRIGAALLTMVPLAYTYQGANGQEQTDVERRPLLDWARKFAKAGQWQSVRGYRIAAGEPPAVEVALRVELFSQAHVADLAKLSQRRLTDLCQLYGVGTPCRVKGGNARAVQLASEFLCDLMAHPDTEAAAGEASTGGRQPPDPDGGDGHGSRAPAYARENASGGGVNHA